MRLNWRRLMTALAMAGCFAMLVPACTLRASGRVRPAYVVTEEPPPPRHREVQPKSGHVWVRGHWEWRGNKWVWKSGHYERARASYDWQPGYWDKQGNRWHWVEGRWVAEGTVQVRDHRRGQPTGGGGGGVEVRDHRDKTPPPRGGGVEVRDHRKKAHPVHPSSPPPARRAETPGNAPGTGYVWVQGHYEWKNGNYDWVNGHWERAQANKQWEPGHWELRGNHYVWVKGRWVKAKAGGGVKVRDHRKKEAPAKPARKNEKVPARRGTPR